MNELDALKEHIRQLEKMLDDVTNDLIRRDAESRLDELNALMTLVEPPDPETSLSSAFEKIEERIKSLRQTIGKL